MNHTVLITGATSGLGLALAKKYLQIGYRVIITGRDDAKLANAKTNLPSNHGELILKNIDVKNKEAMFEFIENMDDTYKIDIVIANAGISMKVLGQGNFDELGRDIFNTNVFGVFNTVHPLIDRMKARRSGKIVLISSVAGFISIKSSLFYTSSKAAVKNYGEALRMLLKPHNVDVINVFPGFFESNITQKNKFKMPFFMGTEKAADIVFKGIFKGTGWLAFPLRMYFIVYFISILPFFIREKILSKLPNK